MLRLTKIGLGTVGVCKESLAQCQQGSGLAVAVACHGVKYIYGNYHILIHTHGQGQFSAKVSGIQTVEGEGIVVFTAVIDFGIPQGCDNGFALGIFIRNIQHQSRDRLTKGITAVPNTAGGWRRLGLWLRCPEDLR